MQQDNDVLAKAALDFLNAVGVFAFAGRVIPRCSLLASMEREEEGEGHDIPSVTPTPAQDGRRRRGDSAVAAQLRGKNYTVHKNRSSEDRSDTFLRFLYCQLENWEAWL